MSTRVLRSGCQVTTTYTLGESGAYVEHVVLETAPTHFELEENKGRALLEMVEQ